MSSMVPHESWNVVATADPDAWLAARDQYLTASDVSAVLDCNPYKSRASVLRSKAAALEGKPLTSRPVGAMYAGQFQEEGVVRWFLHDRTAEALALGEDPPTGGVLRNAAGVSILVAHPDASLRLAASPDALVVEGDGNRYLVEVKVLGPGSRDGEVEGSWQRWDHPCKSKGWARMGRSAHTPCPVPHIIQLQTQLLCTGEGAGWVVGACGTSKTEHPFGADTDLHARIIEATQAFWKELAP